MVVERRRWASQLVTDALSDTPVVVVNGARQVGKTTLVTSLPIAGTTEFLSLDDAATRAFAARDPRSFVERAVDTVVVDEAQLEPTLFRAIKASVDRDRRPGRFLLTGSSRLLAAPDMADSLVGRVEPIELWPFSQGEIEGSQERFVDLLLEGPDALSAPASGPGRPSAAAVRDDVIERLCRGGFPEVVSRQPERRGRWFDAYVRTTVEKVVREIADLERLAEIPRLLRLCAARTGAELNVTELSNQLGFPSRTGAAYVARLVTAFLVQLVPAWSTNVSAKVVRKPKLMIVDSGLAAHLVGATPASLARQPDQLGPLLETFVANEIRNQLSVSMTRATMWHFRDRSGAEVDVVIERPDGGVAGIEVKATASPTTRDAKGLRFLADRLGDRFLGGVLLTLAPETHRLGDRLLAAPVSSLWRV